MSTVTARTFDISPTRRMLLAGTAAVVATTGSTALASDFDADAPLLRLRSRWMEARAAYAAEKSACTPEYEAALASLPSVNGITDREEIGRIIRLRCEVLDQFPAPAALPADAEARQEKAFEDECRAIDEIAATPARTIAGLGFKAEVSAVELHLNPDLLASVMADIAALAAADRTPPSRSWNSADVRAS